MTGSVDGCNVLPETQLVGDRLHVDTTQVLYVGVHSPWGAPGERLEFDIKSPLGIPHLSFPAGYHLKSFPQDDTL